MKELDTFTDAFSGPVEQKPDVQFKKLVNEVMADQQHGATDIDRATAARARLFSRLRFPKSSMGTAVKKPT